MTLLITKVIKEISLSFNYSKRDNLFIGIPILLSIIVKLILLAVLWVNPINNDGTLYINAARQFATGNFSDGLAMYPMPAYPLLLAFLHILIPDWILAGYFISFFSMVLVAIPLYYITKNIFGAKAGFLACMVYAVLPKMNEWSMNISRDPLFLFLIVLCIYFAFRSLSEKRSFFLGTTFVLAWCATLIRIEGVLFIGFYFLVLVYFTIFNKGDRSFYFKRTLIWIGIPICIALLILLSNGVRGIAINRFDNVLNELVYFLSGKFLTKPIEIYKFLSEATKHPPFFDNKYSFVAISKHFMPIIYMFGILQVFVKILSPLSLIPLYLGFKMRTYNSNESDIGNKFILWICAIYIGLGYYFLIKHDFIATRYLIVPAFFCLPWIGHGLDLLYEKAKFSLQRKSILVLVLIILIAPTVDTFRLIRLKDTTTAHTVKWLQNNTKSNNSQIVSNDFKLAFYIDLKAEAKHTLKTLFYNRDKTSINVQEIEKFAFNKKAQFIVLKTKTKYIGKIEDFNFYNQAKAFRGKKYTILIYEKKS